jgi:Molybdopterin-binding domain of aldehyde dehydrogenase
LDFSARTGVLPFALHGNDGDDHRRIYGGGITMDITANTSSATNAGAREYSLVAKEYAVIQGPRARALDVETSAANPLLPTDRKWAIRFTSNGTVTIVLGMKDYGRGWFSGYFASLVAARLGVPFRRIRIYYSGTLPAVLQTPIASATVFSRGGFSPVASAVADIIEQMCDQVVERGRGTFAAMAGVHTGDIGFDRSIGRFFVLDRVRSRSILEIADTVQGGSCSSSTFTSKNCRDNESPLEDAQVPSAA